MPGKGLENCTKILAIQAICWVAPNRSMAMFRGKNHDGLVRYRHDLLNFPFYASSIGHHQHHHRHLWCCHEMDHSFNNICLVYSHTHYYQRKKERERVSERECKRLKGRETSNIIHINEGPEIQYKCLVAVKIAKINGQCVGIELQMFYVCVHCI